jgi:hypothetical protein
VFEILQDELKNLKLAVENEKVAKGKKGKGAKGGGKKGGKGGKKDKNGKKASTTNSRERRKKIQQPIGLWNRLLRSLFRQEFFRRCLILTSVYTIKP